MGDENPKPKEKEQRQGENEKLKPEDALKKAKGEYKDKWTKTKTKIDTYKKSTDKNVQKVATNYENRLKAEVIEPDKEGTVLDKPTVEENLKKINALFEKLESEPVVLYTKRVESDRALYRQAIRDFPNDPFFKQHLARFEGRVKIFEANGAPTDKYAVNACIKEFEKLANDKTFTEKYNRGKEKQTVDTLVGNGVKKAIDKGSLMTSDGSMQVSTLNLALQQEMKRIDFDGLGIGKREGTIPNEWMFVRKGLYIRVGKDGTAAVIGATDAVKAKNPGLASLPTMGSDKAPEPKEPAKQKENPQKPKAPAKAPDKGPAPKPPDQNPKPPERKPPAIAEPVDRASEADKNSAKEKFDAGMGEFNAAEKLEASDPKAAKASYEKALKIFQESYSFAKSPNSHWMMVRCYMKLDQKVKAFDEAKIALQEAKAGGPKYKPTEIGLQKAIDELLGKPPAGQPKSKEKVNGAEPWLTEAVIGPKRKEFFDEAAKANDALQAIKRDPKYHPDPEFGGSQIFNDKVFAPLYAEITKLQGEVKVSKDSAFIEASTKRVKEMVTKDADNLLKENAAGEQARGTVDMAINSVKKDATMDQLQNAAHSYFRKQPLIAENMPDGKTWTYTQDGVSDPTIKINITKTGFRKCNLEIVSMNKNGQEKWPVLAQAFEKKNSRVASKPKSPDKPKA